jgi:hypothetical protein
MWRSTTALVLSGVLIAAAVVGCRGGGKPPAQQLSAAQQLAKQFGHDAEEESAIVKAIKDLNGGSESLPGAVKTEVEKGGGVLDEIKDAADPVVGAACDAYTEGTLGVPKPLSKDAPPQAQTLLDRMVLQVRNHEVTDASVRTACAIHKVTSGP